MMALPAFLVWNKSWVVISEQGLAVGLSSCLRRAHTVSFDSLPHQQYSSFALKMQSKTLIEPLANGRRRYTLLYAVKISLLCLT
ncbi:uncharacterized protein BDR25DRAFT_83049 [Lindgomyces ingoldianus]|uniref:Uncharacterized protein n=1 Tax=Lindgomyces ingoldianus TaxID=673940 RepID=A0ACB6QFQ6_9PLEO|nr:uncharacterized protein BDR25DRAFT_83049 [Lindgomyces ingoldianus]KAF2465798.1 hypothetical protein BDR25DRAFT_83049 [Lindgomyces ingoldianus]